MFTIPQISTSQDEIFLHQNHEFFPNNYLDANAHLDYNNQDLVEGFNGDPHRASKTFPEKSVRKDRHSKIFTAKGPRDRRVRLSIAIARKFFDLQEMLGFDKPSKTLDWLLTKSKSSINDLMEQKRSQNGVVSSSPSECVLSNLESFDNGSDSKRKSGFLNAKEMRIKARARARARTREKMCMKQMNEAITRRNELDLMNTSIPLLHYGIRESTLDCPKDSASNPDSIFMRRKFNQYPSSIFGFQQNVLFSRGSSLNFTENSDISSFSTTQSDVCAILDQHKFIK